jgi:predicted N-formylglutamate amidohydrolase
MGAVRKRRTAAPRPLPRWSAGQLLLSCEHASNRVPAAYAGLGLSSRLLAQHIAWDPGAAHAARAIAAHIGCPVHLATWSRLLVDANRRLGHPKLFAAVSFGVRVPGNAHLSPEEEARRLRLYYLPYRNAVTADVLQLVSEAGGCLHLSIHSFTPVVGATVRNADVGLLYDPRRPREAAFAARLRLLLEAHGLRVRFNYPYLGTSDGFVGWFRKHFPPARYAGLEIELNQRLLARPATARRLRGVLTECVHLALLPA